jgi:hypothetical protein
MTAIVSRERARSASLTGAAGLLLLMVSFVMMVVAAPAHAHHRPHQQMTQLTTDLCHQLTPGNASAAVRGCPAGPAAVSVRTDAYNAP